MSPDDRTSSELIAIACFGKAVGLDGFCSVHLTGAAFPELTEGESILIGTDVKTLVTEQIEKIRQNPKGFLCRLKGKPDRTAAESLTGKTVYIDRGRLPKLDAGRFYQFELIGMQVTDKVTGEDLGVLQCVHNYPTVDSLEIVMGDGRLISVPLVPDAVDRIDHESRKIVLNIDSIEELLQN